MSRPAIFSLLWPKNQRVLTTLVRRQPGTAILSISDLVSDPFREAIAAAGGTVVCVDTLLTREERQALSRQLADSEQALQAALKDPTWQQHWASFPLPPERLAQQLLQVATSQLPALVPFVAALDRASAQYDLRLIALNEDMTALPRLLVAWGKQHRVPSLHLSHGVELGIPYTIHAQLHADITAVFGERGKEGYQDIGLDESCLRITGNPAWDDYPQLREQRTQIRARLALQHGLSPELPIVVFGTTWAANLTAFSDEGIHGKTLQTFLAAAKQLIQAGTMLQVVVKDRPGAPKTAAERMWRLVSELELPPSSVRYATGNDATDWVVAADVMVSMQSNLSVEAMLVGVPAIDMLTEIGTWLGPCFGADSGILEVEPWALSQTLAEVLSSEELRQRQLQAMQRAVHLHNISVDGSATDRVVALMEELIAA